VWLYEGLVGEGWQVTEHVKGVQWFKPFAGGLLYRAFVPEREERKERAAHYGSFFHWEQEESASALYYVGLAELRRYHAQAKAATEDEAKALPTPVIELSRLLPGRPSIRDVIPSPMNDALYLNCWPRDDRVYWRDTITYRIVLDAQSALAEHLRREGTEKAEQKGAQEAPKEPGQEDDDISYLGEMVRLNLPRRLAGRTHPPCGAPWARRQDVHP
jgi:hypothetical protein